MSSQPDTSEGKTRRRRGPVARLFRLICILLILLIVLILTAPLWLSTSPGTRLATWAASRASGQEITCQDLGLSYGGAIVVDQLRVGQDLTVAQASLQTSWLDLLQGRVNLSGTIREPVFQQVTTASTSRPGASPARPSPGSTGTAPGRLPELEVNLQVEDARLELRDETVDPVTIQQVEGLDLQLVLSCEGSLATLTASLQAGWERIQAAGYEINPSELEVRYQEETLRLAPFSYQVSGGTVTGEGLLVLTPGREELTCTIQADGVRPRQDLSPIQGVDLRVQLGGLGVVREVLEGKALSTEGLLGALAGEIKVQARQFVHAFGAPTPLLGERLTVTDLDGTVTLQDGLIQGHNLQALVQEGKVTLDLATQGDGPVTFTLAAAPPGQPRGRLPVENLQLAGELSRDLEQIDLDLTADRIAVEERTLTAIDLHARLSRPATGPAQVAFSPFRCTVDGAAIGLEGQLDITDPEALGYTGTVTVSGHRLQEELSPLEDLRLELALTGIPTSDVTRRLTALRGTVQATCASLPTQVGTLEQLTLSMLFDPQGFARLSNLQAGLGGGEVGVNGSLYLGTDPADLDLHVTADQVTIPDAEGPLQQLAMDVELAGCALVNGLHQPQLSGTLGGTFERLPLPAFTLSAGSFKGSATRGRVEIPEIRLNAAPGELVGQAWIDLAQEEPSWYVKMDNDKVGIRKGYGVVLGYVVPILSVSAGNLGGFLESQVELSGQGLEKQALKRTLEGNGSMLLTEGFVSGSPILETLLPALGGLDRVGITSIKATFDAGEGKIRSDDLDLELEAAGTPIFLGFKGWCDLDGNIDYGVKLRSVERFLPEGIRPYAKLLGEDATFPLRLKGTLEAPTVGLPSKEEIMKSVQGKLLEDPGGAMDRLKGLLGPGKEKEEEKE